MHKTRDILTLACLVMLLAQPAPSTEPEDAESTGPWNLPFKTMGGKQLWTDLLVHGDWRIQRNSQTGHSRLLDEHNIRRAWGSYAHCESQFREYQQAGDVKPLPTRVVLLLHGLGGSRGLLAPLQQHLRKQGLETLCVTYASTRGSIDDHALALSRVIDKLGAGVKRIDFVGHSMGNIVIRRYLRGLAPGSPAQRRIGAMVMLAPPNRGAQLAKIFKDNGMFVVIGGESATQLGDFSKLEPQLAVPACPFGIVAGGGAERNPLLPGDDDLLVGIEETKLGGARDFIVVDSLHRTLPKNPRTMEYTHRFLTAGHFLSDRQRHPLPREPRR